MQIRRIKIEVEIDKTDGNTEIRVAEYLKLEKIEDIMADQKTSFRDAIWELAKPRE